MNQPNILTKLQCSSRMVPALVAAWFVIFSSRSVLRKKLDFSELFIASDGTRYEDSSQKVLVGVGENTVSLTILSSVTTITGGSEKNWCVATRWN